MGVTEKYLELEKELKPFRPLMARAADAILDKEISAYPIFIASQLEVQLGIPLLIRNPEQQQRWFVNASTLEELNTRQIIHTEKVNEFRKVYKDPSLNFCLFVLSDLGAQFIFIPRES
jgi:hypothetical protein